jgi:dihydrofolate reductase
MRSRKIIVQLAMSADGFIARPDGDIAWLTERPDPPDFYGMADFLATIDTILYGRKTFELGLQLGATLDPNIRHCVFSRQPPPASVPHGVEYVNEPVAAFAEKLRARAGKNIWMMGGAELIGAFVDAGAIDEFLLAVMPVLIGEGIPFVAPRHRTVPMQLLSARPYPDGVIMVHYEVERR